MNSFVNNVCEDDSVIRGLYLSIFAGGLAGHYNQFHLIAMCCTAFDQYLLSDGGILFKN